MLPGSLEQQLEIKIVATSKAVNFNTTKSRRVSVVSLCYEIYVSRSDYVLNKGLQKRQQYTV